MKNYILPFVGLAMFAGSVSASDLTVLLVR